MTIAGVSHLGLCVSDIDASMHFYCKLLGFRPIAQFPVQDPAVPRLLELENLQLAVKIIELDGLRLELLDMTSPRPTVTGKPPFNRTGYTHLSIKVLDWDNEIQRLRTAGVPILEHTLGGNQNSNARFVFVLDPDGNRVELIGPWDDSGRKPWDFG